MKKTFLILTVMSMTILVNAQEKTKQKEIGVSFSDLNNFGFTYKFGTNKSLWRINTLLANGSNRTDEIGNIERTSNTIGFGLRFGKEFRKSITDKLELRTGGDVSFYFNRNKITTKDPFFFNDITNENKTYRTGLNFVFGFNYLLSKEFIIGAEVLPGFSYARTEGGGNETNGFDYGLSNSSALLSLAYRF